MQRFGGRLLLPDPGWRRFRLPNLPEEVDARPVPGRRQRRALLVGLWLLISVIAAELTGPEAGSGLFAGTALEPKALWASVKGWLGSKQGDAGGVEADVQGSSSKGSSSKGALGSASTHAPGPPPPVSAPPAPPRVVAGLAPIERQSPAVHQGAQFSHLGSLPSGFESSLEQAAALAAAPADEALLPRAQVAPPRL